MKDLAIAVSAAVMTLASVGAHANTDFDKLDMNGDGYISIEEAKADEGLLAQFNEIDADQDGQLSQAEFDNYEG
ncbi:EF-hand domain-containing protein [Pseudoalteromonas piscicida]|uniref:EF-hand domain-containing protein n=1 Tax=Pseudoalteromonas piscicida TaxID=43662 RepID=UPI003C79FC63